MDALRQAISGRWILCGHQSVFGVDRGDIGLEITPDNHWYKLYEAEGFGTIRGAGFDEEGTWTALNVGEDSSTPQLNLDIFGSGTVITSPVLASMPRAMRLNNNGVFVGNYVIDPTFPMGSVRCAPRPDPTRSGECTPPPDVAIEPTCTDVAATEGLRGRWSRCGGAMPGAPLHDGVEFTSDGSFYFLHRDPTAGLVHGETDRASLRVLVEGPCRVDLFLNTASGVSIGSSAQLRRATPRQLWIFTGPEWGDPERYTFITP
jgi:hypothetical protein